MNEERYQKLNDIIKIYLPEDVSVDEISEESHFINELNINSANLVDIILDVEELHDYLKENSASVVKIEDLISKLEWNIILPK